jgi:hypothetical protein
MTEGTACNLLPPTNTLVLAYAMQWTRATDLARLELLSDQLQARVVTVCDDHQLPPPSHSQDHINANFKSERGQSVVLQFLQENALNFDHVVVVLDYFWLATRYYSTNYGLNWLVQNGSVEGGKCARLLKAGASEIFLPCGGGKENKNQQEMQKMLVELECNSDKELLDVRRLHTCRENPLWAASDAKELQAVLESNRRSSNAVQTLNYLDPQTPFVRVTSGRVATAENRPNGDTPLDW